jgi:hypothetical protein
MAVCCKSTEPKEAPGSEMSWMSALEGSPWLGTKVESVMEAEGLNRRCKAFTLAMRSSRSQNEACL